jgi:dehydro coenzyme F420 reductase / coenzyme F420-0:L-glutamate ligase / coenzyme F420-1:gamma-L-glutamate ligase
VALSAQGVGSCWISSSMFCPGDAAAAIGLDGPWQAMGCVGAGYPSSEPGQRPAGSAAAFLDVR